MVLKVFPDKHTLGEMAALQAAVSIRHAIAQRGAARIVAATGASQFEFLEALVAQPRVDWERVEMFHLDEYAGLPDHHPASFRKYLRERLIGPAGIRRAHLLDGTNHRNVGALLLKTPADVAFVGIGENGHLAFNDPPADFRTDEPYIVVRLDEACRRQQVGEGWFACLEDVPAEAISMSVRQILRAREILCTVPDARKAAAVKNSIEGPVDPMFPASILRTHPNTTLFLDRDSAALLSAEVRAAGTV